MKNKSAAVHGHFYQPPRENPWLDELEPEESAAPYRDWNERIFEECYGPNAACPAVDENGRIVDLQNNYERMSFNVGPTLLEWLERARPELYRILLASDGGRRAVAQPFIHAILPLQTRADKELNVRWGLDDFAARFGRRAEGMWLPETAVDDETLEVLAEAGVRFTVLSPRQAARLRDQGSEEWRDAEPSKLLPTRPYLWRSSARPELTMAIFFYHEILSQGVVSGESLKPAPDALARKVLARFLPDDSSQLVTVASDGEFYGHHHKNGAAALATSLRALEEAGVPATSFIDVLDRVPPPQEVELRQNTAWSCEHGLGRWTLDCGCRSAHLPNWTQAWRGPLRAAFDALSLELDKVYETHAGNYFRDYRVARERWGAGRRRPDAFLTAHALKPLAGDERRAALSLLELQRQRLAMFTSCGWFFDDVSGLEAVQCLKHAARAVDLARGFGADLEPAFLAALEGVPSNDGKLKTAAGVYKTLVLPSRVDMARAAAHFALCAHIDGDWPQTYGFDVERLGGGRLDHEGIAGRDRSLSFCQLRLRRRVDGEELEATVFVHQRDRVDFAVWVKPPEAAASFAMLGREFHKLENDEDLRRAADKRLGALTHTLEALFQEERRHALRLLMPGPGDSPSRKDFLTRWRAAVARLRQGGGDDEALALLAEAPTHRMGVQQLPWCRLLSEEVSRAFEAAVAAPSPAALSRAGRWLEACEAAGLPVSLWRLRELFWRWRAALATRAAAPAEREAAVAFGEKLGFADSVLPLGTEVSR